MSVSSIDTSVTNESAGRVLEDMPIDASGFFDGKEELFGDLSDVLFRDGKRVSRPGILSVPTKRFVSAAEDLDLVGVGGLPDGLGHIQREEVAAAQKAVNGLEMHMVGIDKVRLVPAECLDGRIGLGPYIGRPGADDAVFAIRFVPDGRPRCPRPVPCRIASKLGNALTAEAVADAH
jgi:hypothetical protein